MRIINIFLIGICFMNVCYANQNEHLLWAKVPLSIELPVDQERLVQFPKNIKIIYNGSDPALDILKVQNSLYLKAKQPFKKSRIIVQLLPAGETILIDLNASNQYINTTPIEIMTEAHEADKPQSNSYYEYNAIQLTRFAIQALYSPERVHETPVGIYRTPMQTHKTVPLFYDTRIEAHPITSWRGGFLYVTAVALINLVDKPITLSPKKMRGQWQTASFYPNIQLPPNHLHDTSTVFLVSEQPFQEALPFHVGYQR